MRDKKREKLKEEREKSTEICIYIYIKERGKEEMRGGEEGERKEKGREGEREREKRVE